MKGYQIDRHLTSLDELGACLSSSLPDPVPAKDEILVDVHSVGLNFFDIIQTQGKYQVKPAHPYIAGAEFSGTVAAGSPIPPGCTFVPGQTRVFGATQGAFADVATASWRACVPVPDGMSFEEAAGLFVTYPTSYGALRYRADIQKGETLLVLAAAGGVGMAAVQIGKAMGARVIAACGTQAKLEVCKRYGADEGVDYTKEGWQKEVLKLTGGKGVDVVYDPVGMIVPSMKCIAWNGRLIVVGFAAGAIEKIPANLILLKNIAVTGVHWGAYTKNEPARIAETWAALLDMFAKKQIKGVVYDKVYEGLESVPDGLRALGSRGTWGKVVVRVGGRGSKI